jgi:hypothetical protein
MLCLADGRHVLGHVLGAVAILPAGLKRLAQLPAFPDILSGLTLGLYAGRVCTELLLLPLGAALILTAILILLSIALTAALGRHGVDTRPLLLLGAYVVWPCIRITSAVGIALVTVVAFWHVNGRLEGRIKGTKMAHLLLGDALLFLVSLALYLRTLAPTILPADSGEFQFVSYVLGIAHPPGYPLYTMLAKLFTFLPVGDIAYRVNLFSAVTSALTLVVLSRAVRRVTGSTLSGCIAAAVLAVAPTFWAQGTTANIRSLTALFTALQVDALIHYAQNKSSRYLLVFAVTLGLGITHHTSLVPLVVAYLLFLGVSDPEIVRRPQAWLRPALAFLLSLFVLLYLPLRSWMGAPFDSQPIRSVSAFLEHILALGFRGDMFYFVQPAILLSRLRVFINILVIQFGWLWLLFALLGAVSLLLRRQRLLLLLGGIFAINALLAITYRAPQTVEYLMPTYVVLAFIGALGIWSVSHALRLPATWRGAVPAVLLSVALWIPFSTLAANYPSFLQLSRDRSTRQYAEGILAEAPQGACILSNWHFATAFWYLQYVEAMRPDVEVVYVYPQGAEPIAQTWLHRVEQSSAMCPTVVTNQSPGFATLPYEFRPFGGAWLVQTGPVYEAPSSVRRIGVLFDQRIELIGYDLDSSAVSPADSLIVRLYWRPVVKLERDYSFFVHIVDETGVPLGQGDISHPAARYEVGRVLLDEYRIPLLPTAKPGQYKLIAGVYLTLEEGGWRRLTTQDGRDTTALDTVEIRPMPAAPVTAQGMSWRFAGGYTLVGADYDHSLPGQLRLYLHWRVQQVPAQAHRVVILSKEDVLAAVDLAMAPVGSYFTTAHDLPAEASNLALELQNALDGRPAAWLGPWRLALGRRVRLPAPSMDARYVPLGGEMVLTRVEYSAAVDRGSSLSAVLTFVGARPLTHDYTVSVSLTGEADRWQAQHDGTPALGAIPTLKWIRGTTVRDEHHLALPSDAVGSGVLRLTVYDAFTIQPLPVLDERLARLGQGTQIDLGTVDVASPQ